MVHSTAVGVAARKSSAVMVVFGSAWLLIAAGSLDTPAGVVLGILGLLTAMGLMLASRRWLNDGESEPSAAANRTYRIVNILQWLAIPVVAVACGALGRPSFIPPAIVGIVGLHFMPFANAFHWAGYRIQGYALLCVSAIAMVAALLNAAASATRAITGIGAAAAIWGGVAAMLAIALRRASDPGGGRGA